MLTRFLLPMIHVYYAILHYLLSPTLSLWVSNLHWGGSTPDTDSPMKSWKGGKKGKTYKGMGGWAFLLLFFFVFSMLDFLGRRNYMYVLLRTIGARWETAQQNRQAAHQHGGASASSTRHPWQVGAFPPTPPLSTSPGSCESSCHEDAYFPPTQGYAASSSGYGSGTSPIRSPWTRSR